MSAIWKEGQAEGQTYPQLHSRLDVDTLVIGAGITGLTTALKLLDQGQRVAVVEALHVGAGTTGASTGNLYGTLSSGLSNVEKKWGADVTREVVSLRNLAVDLVEDLTQRFSIHCQFTRRLLYVGTRVPDSDLGHYLQLEYDSAADAGLNAALTDSVPELPFPLYRALRIQDQAQFNPLHYVQGLARAVTEMGGLIFEGSRVSNLDANQRMVTTYGEPQQGEVHARNIVQATHTPKGINLLQAAMQPFLEYGVAARLKKPCGDGIFWIISDSQSLRTYTYDNEQYVVAVGEKHRTGEPNGRNHYQELSSYLQTHFDTDEVRYQWAAQQFMSADLLPYIGHSGHEGIYVATGYGADGLTWGTVAATLISNQILGRACRGAELFDPRRFTPLKSAKNWVKENVSVTKHLVQDYFTHEDAGALRDVLPGEGRIMMLNGEDVAVYRAADNTLSVLSPICPHLKCKVKWNDTDSTWDCPCHGSRFAPVGNVLEGPALTPLTPHSVNDHSA